MDWNNDGKNDLIAGDTQGNVWLFLNTGTKEKPELAEGKRVEADGKPIGASRRTYKRVDGRLVVDKVVEGSHPLADTYSKLHVADWDGDGLKDLLVGHSRTVVFYKNVGTKSSPRLQAPVLVKIPGGNFPSRPSPYVVDWDKDGKKDLLVGCETGEIRFYRNEGTNKEPKLARGVVLDLKGPSPQNKGYRWRLDVTDWNNDGKLDLLVGNRIRAAKPSTGGNIWLFLGK